MSLDTWLRSRSPLNSTTPVKKFKISAGAGLNGANACIPVMSLSSENEDELSSGSIVSEFHRDLVGPKLYPALPRYRTTARHATSLYDSLPETILGTTIAQSWACKDQYQLESSPVWIEPLLLSPLAICATKSQKMVYTWDTLQPREQETCNSGLQKVASVPFEWDIMQVSSISSNQLLCASRIELCLIDVNEQKTSDVPFFKHEDIKEISSLKPHSDGRLIALGTAAGGIDVWDLREKSWTRSWKETHATTGSIISLVSPAISKILWNSDNVLVTATSHNESVKFWDLRARTNSPLMVTNERTSSPSHHLIGTTSVPQPASLKGICDMVTLNGTVWAINEASELLNLSPYQPMPECKIKARSPMVLGASQSLIVINDGLHQVLGCAGEFGLITVVPPSNKANELGVDATCGFCLSQPVLAYDLSNLAFNQVSQRVLGASHEGKTLFTWKESQAPRAAVKVRQKALYF